MKPAKFLVFLICYNLFVYTILKAGLTDGYARPVVRLKQQPEYEIIALKDDNTATKTLIVLKPVFKTPIKPEILEEIKKFEGFKSKAYYDEAGLLTIGYGFTRHDIPSLSKDDVMTKEQADKLLPEIIESKYVPVIKKYVKVPLNDNQFGSLVSFVYNVGESEFKKSTLLYFVNRGKFKAAADEFEEWTKVGGRSLKGLSKRRGVERSYFLAQN
jgi:lysozyme